MPISQPFLWSNLQLLYILKTLPIIIFHRRGRITWALSNHSENICGRELRQSPSRLQSLGHTVSNQICYSPPGWKPYFICNLFRFGCHNNSQRENSSPHPDLKELMPAQLLCHPALMMCPTLSTLRPEQSLSLVCLHLAALMWAELQVLQAGAELEIPVILKKILSTKGKKRRWNWKAPFNDIRAKGPD